MREGRRRFAARVSMFPTALPVPTAPEMSTQEGFGRILFDLGREQSEFAKRIVTTSPDVTVSTNLGGWVNRRGVFDRTEMEDRFKEQKIASTYRWSLSPQGQHIELGIAENNLFTLLAALGLSHSLFGERLLPIGTLYDPFIARGLDALNYACYQDARFILVATPSGVTLAPEGGAHQSIGTPLIGMAQDGLASFEPAFVDELAILLAFAFDYIQRDGKKDAEQSWLRDETGGSVYLRLSTRPLEQPKRKIDESLARDIIDGGYWLRPPGPNCEIVIAYQGVVAPEAIAAAGFLAEDRRDVAVLAVTSADRLNAGWQAASRARMRGLSHASSHVERLLSELPAFARFVTVIDGHPATLSWLGGVRGDRVTSLGVEHFGQSRPHRRSLCASRHRHQGDPRSRASAGGGEAGPASASDLNHRCNVMSDLRQRRIQVVRDQMRLEIEHDCGRRHRSACAHPHYDIERLAPRCSTWRGRIAALTSAQARCTPFPNPGERSHRHRGRRPIRVLVRILAEQAGASRNLCAVAARLSSRIVRAFRVRDHRGRFEFVPGAERKIVCERSVHRRPRDRP